VDVKAKRIGLSIKALSAPAPAPRPAALPAAKPQATLDEKLAALSSKWKSRS